MAISANALEQLLQGSSSASSLDRKALGRLLAELARSVDTTLAGQASEVPRFDPRLEQLRTLLLGREIESLARLSHQIDDPEELAGAVSRVLPAAIAQASTRDGTLGEVLAPAVERATRTSIRSDPQTLVNILYPLILPAIRKSIGEGIDATFQSLNESLKHSLSWRGLRWRWEAWRSGVSFATVVLRHTLVFQVEHAFLIHRHTGLLIAHVAADDAVSQDPQIISSMLVAIQDFVRDSFTAGDQQGLDALRLGELTLWSEAGAFATLVAVIRGNPPESLHDTLRETLTRIHTERGQALQTFSGDSAAFPDVEAQLRESVLLRQEARPVQRSRYPSMVLSLAVIVLVLFAGWLFHWWRDERRWDDYVGQLRAEPGIVITDVGKHHGKWEIGGLRDPLAADPRQMLRSTALDPARVVEHWQPYQGFNPDLVLKRLVGSLQPPTGLSFSVAGDRIVARGSASYAWLQRAATYIRALPDGAPIIDLSHVRDLNQGALGQLRASIQSMEIRFAHNESLPAPSEEAKLDQLASQLRDLDALSASLHVVTRVTVTGHSDATGKGTSNLSLSLARAEAVRALLKKRGVDPDLLSIRGAGPLEPLEDEATDAARSANRRVSLTVAFD
ncbi:MAG TPA: OmpA family protein [Steroidobacteraceae bacterium]|nr:OmpA family protein [Steroidobacteraceae bacterium]